MNKRDKMLTAALIFGIIILAVSMFFASYLNVYLKAAVSAMLAVISVAVFVFTVITYDRNSFEDTWNGVRLEIFGLCLIFIVWSAAIHFI